MNTLHFLQKTHRLFLVAVLFTHSIAFFGQTNDNQQQKDSIRNTFAHLEGIEKLRSYQQLGFIMYAETIDKSSFDALMAFYKEFDDEAKKQKNMKVQGILMINTLMAMKNLQMYDEIITKAPEYL